MLRVGANNKIRIRAEDLREAIELTNKQGNCESIDCTDHLDYVPVHVLLCNLGVTVIQPRVGRGNK